MSTSATPFRWSSSIPLQCKWKSQRLAKTLSKVAPIALQICNLFGGYLSRGTLLPMRVSFIPSVGFFGQEQRSRRCSPRMSLQPTRVTFRNAHGENLVALLTTKESATQQALNTDIAVLCHGFLQSKNCALMTYLSENLPFATARIDFSGNGESEGDFKFGNYRKEVDDLRALILYLRGVGGNVTTIVGHSKGGNAVLLYGAKYGDVRNVVNLAGRYDMRRGVRERVGNDRFNRLMKGESITVSGIRNGEKFEYCISKEDIEARFAVKMQNVIEGISDNVRVLTLHGNDDTIVPSEDGREIGRRTGNGKCVILEGCGHVFDGFKDRIVGEIVGFVRE